MDFVWNTVQSFIFENVSRVSRIHPSNLIAVNDARQQQHQHQNGGGSSERMPFIPGTRTRFGTMDSNCPVCLNQLTLPIETNCGHLFCGRCIIIYWQHAQWRGGAIRCPVCRQGVNILLPCFSTSNGSSSSSTSTSSASSITHVIREINTYNRRFSGEPRPWSDYLYDLPTLLRHLTNDFFSFNGLMYMFRIRIVLCVVAAIMYLISPLDMIPEAVFGIFGLFDDIVVVLLLAIYVTIIYRRFLSARWEME
ncbi:hypothetical protein TYRP_006377 [Tyrophagus putrescentiae]|nr:hypothetical protein TYRP_006377 [Tyrophagus putrescentiae]